MRKFLILLALTALLACAESSKEAEASRKAESRNLHERGIRQKLVAHRLAAAVHGKAAAAINAKAAEAINAKVPRTTVAPSNKQASASNRGPVVRTVINVKDSYSGDTKGPSAAANGRPANGNEPWHSPAKGPYGGGGFAAEKEADPNLEKKADMARFLVHHSKSMVLTTRPVRPGFTQYTDASIQLVVDTINGASTGKPYLYLNMKDPAALDVHFDHQVSLLFTRVAVDDFCRSLPLMDKDVACSRTLLQGEIVPMFNETTAEAKAVYQSFIDKYPGMKNENPEDYIMGYMKIAAIWVHGDDGGAERIPLDVYNKASPDNDNANTETIVTDATTPAS